MESQNGLESKVSAALNCINLSNADIHQSAALLKQACMDSGIFYIINHGISMEFMDELFAQSKKFFALPLEEKLKLRVEGNRGYYNQSLNKFFDQETNQQAHGESYRLITPETEDDLDPKMPFCGPNVWPSADVLPGWKEKMMRYQQDALNVGRKIARVIALALDLKVDFFDQPEILGNAMTHLTLIHYGVQEADSSEAFILGPPAHTDSTFITLLATDEVPGLQICRNKHANPRVWENVAPLKGAFIVNIGDILERMSNCVFSSTLHRVLFREERYTIAYFVHPNQDAMIECLPTCKSENPHKYSSIKTGDYILSRFTQLAADTVEDN